jgi:HK97 family phage prohead protease
VLTRDYALKLNVKALDDSSGTFTGLASTYGGPPDLVDDVIEPGAFKAAIMNQPNNGYPMLWAHRSDEPIGTCRISDSQAGLRVVGSLLLADPTAQRAYMHLKAGSVKGISIGYSLPPESSGKTVIDGQGIRHLSEVFLHECSLVAIPANPRAQVDSVKSLSQMERLLAGIKQGDMTDDVAAQLRRMDMQLRSLLRKDALCDCGCPECLAGDCENCSDPECDDPNCEGSMQAQQDDEDVAALKSFAASLKTIIAG